MSLIQNPVLLLRGSQTCPPGPGKQFTITEREIQVNISSHRLSQSLAQSDVLYFLLHYIYLTHVVTSYLTESAS